MGSDNHWKQQEVFELPDKANYLSKFKLYETLSNFYLIGWNKSKTIWRVLKIDRSESSKLIIVEDSAEYTEVECYELLQRINDGNKSTGGLKPVTTCYGIVGFIRFLGPYYMLLIIEKKKIGMICGHSVFAITKSRMIAISNSTKNYSKAYYKNENRYKKLLQSVDLTKDFFFSYSYKLMLSLQKNLSNKKLEMGVYETMFVWNEFLTRDIRNQLKNYLWTVALVHGFFKQAKLRVSGRDFFLTLIARRSCHYAGTRYLKRGVNEKGRVANDVETEQIVFEDFHEGRAEQISSVVQNRGSIPLFWSQESSRLNLKPNITLSRKDPKYEATKLHFQNLVRRYGNPIIILNLIKTREKKPRESILRAEFANAIDVINADLTEENRLKFVHWDLNRYSRVATSALARLVGVASTALDSTGIFYCQLPPMSCAEKSLKLVDSISSSEDLVGKDADSCGPIDRFLRDINNGACNSNSSNDLAEEVVDNPKPVDEFLTDFNDSACNMNEDFPVKPPTFQKGVLRTNCIDCLDRTNVAQYAFGLVALGRQLNALGFINAPFISLDFPLAGNLMKMYEEMGDTLALQYGGSPAHNKIFSEKRGQWKAATQSQEFFKALQRYYSNAYMDGEKQDAINIFLGHFQPQPGKPALWELHSDQHYNVERLESEFVNDKSRQTIKRSFSDGNIICESSAPLEIPESTTEISTRNGDIAYAAYTPSLSGKKAFHATQPDFESDGSSWSEQGGSFACSNFIDVDWISSSGNSCEEDFIERSALLGSPHADVAFFGNTNKSKGERSSLRCGSPLGLMGKQHSAADIHLGLQNPKLSEYSDTFINWVIRGKTHFSFEDNKASYN